jgi:hypothetical protein
VKAKAERIYLTLGKSLNLQDVPFDFAADAATLRANGAACPD